MSGTLGRYVLEDLLGRGGGGEVWKALDPELQRYVALKVLSDTGGEDRERFMREARSAAALNHPNIVGVHEVGEADGKSFIALEFVDGPSADRETLAFRRAAEIIRDASRAVHHAHERGVVHRDIKPANILIEKGGRVVVTDFGLARQIRSESRLTVTGTILGTPTYMSPEQAKGDVDQVGVRSDVYSLGATLYSLAARQEPFTGETAYEIVRKVVETPPLPPRRHNPRIHPDLEVVILKAMEKEQALRYATAAELAADLQRYADGEPILARPPSIRRKIVRVVRRRLPIVVSVSILLVAFVAWAVFSLTRPGKILFRVTPPGATIEVDGSEIRGNTAVVAAGVHQIRVRAPDHAPVERPVRVERNASVDVEVHLVRETGFLEVEAEPPGTVVVIGGRSHGTPLRDHELPTGRHVLWLERQGHTRVRLQAEIARGKRSIFRENLSVSEVWFRDFADWSGNHLVGDADGDGVPDIGSVRYGETILVVSGATGKGIIDERVSAQVSHWLLWEDLNGDGVAEVAGAVFKNYFHPMAFSLKGRGSELWRRRDIRVYGPQGSGAPASWPLIADLDGDGWKDLIVVSRHLHGLKGSDGSDLWVHQMPEAPRLTNLMADADRDGVQDVLMIADAWTRLVSGRSGRTIWHRDAADGVFLHQVHASGEYLFRSEEDLVWAAPDTGKEVRRARVPEFPLVPNWGPMELDPSCTDWMVQVVPRGFEYWSVADGRRLWRRDRSEKDEALDQHDVDRDGIPDVLLFEGEPAAVLALGGRDGSVLWRFPSSRPKHIVYHGGFCILAGGTRAVALDLGSGKVRWQVDLPGKASGHPSICDYDRDGEEEIYLGTSEGHVLAISLKTGREAYSALASTSISGRFQFHDTNGDGLMDVYVDGSGPALLRGPKVLWRRTTGNAVRAGPVFHDVTGDGRPDVFLPIQTRDRQQCVAALDGRTGATLWIVRGGYDLISPLTLVDLDRDGRKEVVAWSSRGVIDGLDAGSGERIWEIPFPESDQGYAEIAAGDLDGDGTEDLIACGWQPKTVTAFSGRLREKLWEVQVARAVWRPPLILDLEGRGKPDVFAATVAGEVLRLEGATGKVKWKVSTPNMNRASVAVLRLPEPVALVSCADFSLYFLDADTGEQKLFLVGGGGTSSVPAVADIDGEPVAVLGTWDGTICVTGKGEVRWRCLETEAETPDGKAFVTSPVVADMEGDGEREVVVASVKGTVYCLSLRTGSVVWRHQVGKEIEGRPGVADLDRDGILDVVVGSYDRSVTCITGRGRRK